MTVGLINNNNSWQDPEFDPQKILAKSTAASGLCAWVINIHNFYNVFLVVEPKQRALEDAQNELKAAQDKLDFLNNKILVSRELYLCSKHLIKTNHNKSYEISFRKSSLV